MPPSSNGRLVSLPPHYAGLIAQLSAASALVQVEFINNLLPQLCHNAVLRCQALTTELCKRDFLGDLPTDVVNKIVGYLDRRSLARASRVSKKWHNNLPKVWKVVLQRYGVDVPDEAGTPDSNVDDTVYLYRAKRINWRYSLWDYSPVNVLTLPNSGDNTLWTDGRTICYIPFSLAHQSTPRSTNEVTNRGYLVTSMAYSGSLVIRPEVDNGAATYFINLGVLGTPTCCEPLSQSMLLVGHDSGVVQMWQWRTGVLGAQLHIAQPITCVDYCPYWDLIAIGCADGCVHLIRLATGEVLDVLLPTGNAQTTAIACKFLMSKSLVRSAYDSEDTFRVFLGIQLEEQTFSCLYAQPQQTRKHISVRLLEVQQSNYDAGDGVVGDSIMCEPVLERRSDSIVLDIQPGLQTRHDNSSFMFISVDVENTAVEFDGASKTAYLHEYNVLMGLETVRTLYHHDADALTVDTMTSTQDDMTSVTSAYNRRVTPDSGMGASLWSNHHDPNNIVTRQWRVLGAGIKYACVLLQQTTQHVLTGFSSREHSVLIFNLTTEQKTRTPADWTDECGVRVQTLSSGVRHTTALRIAPTVPGHYLHIHKLCNRSWLDGLDGENDSGLMLLAEEQHAYNQLWRPNTYCWSEPEDLCIG